MDIKRKIRTVLKHSTYVNIFFLILQSSYNSCIVLMRIDRVNITEFGYIVEAGTRESGDPVRI